MARRSGRRGLGKAAMIMAAGFGTRMQPLTADLPKPLVVFDGKPLIDHALERLTRAGVKRVVVNVHYLADQMEAHLAGVEQPEIIISDERSRIMDTGGGIKRALPSLGDQPFIVMNTDSLWAGGAGSNLERLKVTWNGRRMDSLLLLAPTVDALGYDGPGDFAMDPLGRLRRAEAGEIVPFVNTGVYMVHPRLFADTPDEPFSMNLLWDRAIRKNRLYGCRIDGSWMHIGSPEALEEAEALFREMTQA